MQILTWLVKPILRFFHKLVY
eukprot:COSAG02_NODE_18472_length_936_cov_1.222222_2_plen_20_part_01